MISVTWALWNGLVFSAPHHQQNSIATAHTTMNSLNYAWRFVGTSLLWFFFGAIGVLLSVFVFPLLFLFVRSPDRRQVIARKIIAATFSAFMNWGQRMGVFSYRVIGMQHLAAHGGQLILANHPTLIDVVLLLSVLKQVDCVVKDAVVRNPFMRASVTTANYISNREPGELLDVCVKRLQSRTNLLLFPEGTRTREDHSLEFKLGAAEVAIRAGAPILPVIIDCKPSFLGKHDPWYRIPPARPHFEVTILPPAPVAHYVPEGLDRREKRHQLNDALVSLFEAELS
jgi:1-acyl-sn-glycerol-3-phosphate acyltransferase